MSFDDFCKNYTHIDLCHLINTSYFSLSKTWHEGEGIGEWKTNRCGGSVGNKDFLLNPQVWILHINVRLNIIIQKHCNMLSSKHFVKVVLRFQYEPEYVMFKIELDRFKILKFCTFYHEMHFNISYKGTNCKNRTCTCFRANQSWLFKHIAPRYHTTE